MINMENLHKGPEIKTLMYCDECVNCSSIDNSLYDDSSHKYYCNHHEFESKRYIGFNKNTPSWCPYIESNVLSKENIKLVETFKKLDTVVDLSRDICLLQGNSCYGCPFEVKDNYKCIFGIITDRYLELRKKFIDTKT